MKVVKKKAVQTKMNRYILSEKYLKTWKQINTQRLEDSQNLQFVLELSSRLQCRQVYGLSSHVVWGYSSSSCQFV